MDRTLRRLVELLSEGNPEVRCAAAVSLGALGSSEARVVAALRERLKDENPLLRRFAAEGLGRIGARRALPDLLALVASGGDAGRAAAEAAASMGTSGVRGLTEAMSKVAPGVRRIIAAAIAHGGGKAAARAALDSLLDSDPAVVEAARASIESEAAAASPPQKRELARRLFRFLRRKDAQNDPTALAAVVRLFETLAEPGMAPALWKFAAPANPDPVRAAALRALSGLPPPKEKARILLLLDALGAGGLALAEPALRLLEKAEVPRALEERLVSLLGVTEPKARSFAFRKLRTHDTPEVAKALVEHLDHPDPEIRREAEATAVSLRAGRAALLARLDRAKDGAEASRVAAVFLSATDPFDPATDRSIAVRALRWIERGDPRWEAGLHCLRRAKRGEAFEMLLGRARAMRRAKKWKEALAFYRLIANDRRFSPPDRFDLAVVGLHLGDPNPSPLSRERDPALGHLEALLRSEGFDLLAAIKKERSLGPRELYYVGFHFSERPAPARGFGGEALRLVVARSPRSAEGKAAKNKLAREVLV